MVHMLKNGIQIRWLNTAGFEVILPGGAHLLIDPWLDSSNVYPISLDKIEHADYILLSHIHGDHADDIGRIMEKFPKARLFLGDLSTDALCTWQHISLADIYRVRGGEEYIFDDVKIQVFSGRHTENARGVYRDTTLTNDPASLSSWYGSMEMQNYLLTTTDGTRILFWGGQTTVEQKYRLQGLKPDIAVMHLSPKQDAAAFADMICSIGAQVVIPHHHDLTEPLFAKHPELINAMLSPETQAIYVKDGKFSGKAFVNHFNQTLKELVPTAEMMELEHHRWYHFGLAFEAKD